ncbi:MAG: hypothetical protein AAGF81_02795 [Pseudomonadota bacterium]
MTVTLFDLVSMLLITVGLLGLMWSVERLSTRFDIGPEVKRKLVHVATGCTALTFPVLFSGPVPVIIFVVLATVLLLVMRNTRLNRLAHLGSVLHDVERKSHGEIYLAVAIGVLFFRSGNQPVLYVLPLLVITLSDTASALIGTVYGRSRFAVEGGAKSLEGVAAFFVVTWLCAMIVLLLMTDAGRVNVIVLSLAIAAFCALVEADSWNGLDNLFVPIGAHLFLASHLNNGPGELAAIAAAFIGTILVVQSIAPSLKISSQAARGYAILMLLVLSVTQWQNAILPAFAIAMHLVARRTRPGLSERPDFNLILIATGVALAWLVTGEMLGESAINLFNLTFAAVGLAFAGLALHGAWRLALAPIGACAGALVLWVAEQNPQAAFWFDPGWPIFLLALGLPALAGATRPEWFARARSFKAFGLSLILPMGIFVFKGVLA